MAQESLEQTVDEPEESAFVAVSNSKTKIKGCQTRGSRAKGKGRYVPPVEKHLSDLLKNKIELLEKTSWLRNTLAQLTDHSSTHSRSSCSRCICFGLGSLRHSPKSLLQLAFLVILFRRNIIEAPRTVLVDPDFTEEDISFLRTLGFEIQDYQDEMLQLAELTFLYMPHCPRWLYEKLLEVNKDALDNMLLLSNDLSLYGDRELRSDERAKIPRLLEVGRGIKFKIHTLAELEERPDAFNDMAWQWLQRHEQAETPKGAEGGALADVMHHLNV